MSIKMVRRIVSRTDKNIFQSFVLSIVLLYGTNYSNNNNNISDGNIIITNEDAQRRSSAREKWFCIRLLKNKYFPFILFLLVILIVILNQKQSRINHWERNLQINQSCISETENQSNRTEKQWNNILSEKNAIIEQLNKTLIEMKQERSRINSY
jgi:septal ring factor EnvC (AmiA/AmiB activator)